MEAEIQIRPEKTQDWAAISRVNSLAFGRPEEARLVEQLRALPGFDPHLSLVAELGGEIVGHVLFFPLVIRTALGNQPALGLGPVAVVPEHQRQGLGGCLIRAGLVAAREAGHQSCIVLGHPDYYPRFGFQPASRWGLKSTWEVPDEVFMALELEPGALAGKAGLVIYAEPFNTAT